MQHDFLERCFLLLDVYISFESLLCKPLKTRLTARLSVYFSPFRVPWPCARGLPKERQTGVVLVLEASTVEAAETALSQLPFYRHGFIRFDLIPVGPFTNFERLFS